MSDFVAIIGQLSDFIQNERTSAFNEGMETARNNLKEWMRLEGITPKGEYMPELLDEIAEHLRGDVKYPEGPNVDRTAYGGEPDDAVGIPRGGRDNV